ncbi:MAG: orotate phosphoribosyltransferase [Candidatus Poseidoniaceae archaeon]|nr:orotate phosphoribosyltransferase [Candidatus Poseidoniaceae archaeon]
MTVHPELRQDPRWEILRGMVRELAYLKAGEDEWFTLASGRKSKHFFDTKPLMMNPEASQLLGQLLNIRLDDWGVDLVGGLELGAVPLTAIAVATAPADCSRLGFMIRKEPKGRGGRKTNNPPGIEGSSVAGGGSVVVLEDVTTTGGSSLKAVQKLQDETPCDVRGVISIVDRAEGGAEAFVAAGIRFESLFTLNDIAES